MELSIRNERVRIETMAGGLEGALWMPDDPAGVIVIASENGTHRLRPADDYLPSVLRRARLATLVVDMEPRTDGAALQGEPHDSLPHRCVRAACDWVHDHEPTAELPLGLVGVGEGASAVLQTASELGRQVCALVARSARRRPALSVAQISAPTLLIAGSLEEAAVERSRAAYAELRCKKRFEIVPGATRSFDEPGALEVVARLARGWFLQHVHAAPAIKPGWRH